MQCIGEAFGVDPSDDQQRQRLSIKPATLTSLFDLFLKTREKMNTGSSSSKPSASSSATPLPKGPTAADKQEAEKLKSKGNTLMSSKQYDSAIEAYSQAIKLDGTNAVFYSNRAAAYSSKGEHESAVADAEKAIELDPSFTKAYHRLGYVYLALFWA